jgi:hypothetical protein
MDQIEKTRGSTRKMAPDPARQDWVQSLDERAGQLENEIVTFLRERPLAALGSALGLGLAGYFLIKKYQSAPSRSRSSRSKKSASAGILSRGLVPMLERFQGEFSGSGIEGIVGAKDKITSIFSEELAERPLPTIGAVIALGYGLGGLEADELKRGAMKFAQRIAIQSLDAGIDSSLPKKSAQLSKLNPEGATHEYEQHEIKHH